MDIVRKANDKTTTHAHGTYVNCSQPGRSELRGMPGLGEASQREKGDAQLPVPNGEVQMWQKGEEGFRVFDMA